MAASPYRVALHVAAPFDRRVRRRPLAALARRALAEEAARPGVELSVVVTDDETVMELNRRYRGVDEPTDVLSFGLDDRDDGFAAFPDAPTLLGEIVISYPTAERQAAAAGRPLEDELAHLLAHGVLHVLGYDHERPAEARRMRAREEALLGRPAH